MKHIKLFEQFLSEAKVPSFLSKLGKWTQLEADDDILDGTDYTKVSSFMLETDTDLDYSGIIINIYDDKDFSIFFDSAPISLSAHSKREAISMAQTMNEHPLPLSNLNKKELDKIVNDLKSEYLDESVTDEELNEELKEIEKLFYEHKNEIKNALYEGSGHSHWDLTVLPSYDNVIGGYNIQARATNEMDRDTTLKKYEASGAIDEVKKLPYIKKAMLSRAWNQKMLTVIAIGFNIKKK